MNAISVGNLWKFAEALIKLGISRRDIRDCNCSQRVRLFYGDGTTRTVSKIEELPGALACAVSAELI